MIDKWDKKKCLRRSGSPAGGFVRAVRAMSQLVYSCPMIESTHWVPVSDSEVAELQVRKAEKGLGASALKRERKHYVKRCPFPPTSLTGTLARY